VLRWKSYSTLVGLIAETKLIMKSSNKFHLFCKSYIGDLTRALMLWESIKKHNRDDIPFWLSVPYADLDEFKSFLALMQR